ncbi:CapA family protein [Brevibacillus panacihumi]|uniref:CapA family protein n=1 Tax=Brevibacillus panacihumi TaxID=497735 RepID=A0A3M8CU00_9BACL|nr:CapA family protein [Brevibacillus panacihumi]RNB79276.1 CapA family protein [Brevibacillus panacihumi]
MKQTRTQRVMEQRKKKRRIWLQISMRTILFCLIAVLAVGAYSFFKTFFSDPDEASRFPETGPDSVGQMPEPAPEPHVHLSFVGDVMMAGNVEKMLIEKGYDYPYTEVATWFAQDDITIANLETPVTTRGTPPENKAFIYKSPPAALPALKEAGIDVVNLANNHSMDQGVEGLLDTFSFLDKNQIAYIGAGKDMERAYAPVIIEKNGIRVAFLGFSRVIPEVSWYAGKNKPGMAATYDPALAVKAIQEARTQADLVVVIPHWGEERKDDPVDHQTQLARAYIDAGADLVVGGHPHVLQGFETYKDKWIAYSLGNFVFTRSTEPRTWESIILQASCTKSGNCALKAIPVHAELARAVPMNDTDGQILLKRLESISINARIHSDGSVSAKD